jgi:hypothetical protein
MSLSGNNTGALQPYTARQMLESALRRAGVPPLKWSSEVVAIAFDVFNQMLSEMLNLGVQLWARDMVILPLYMNRNEVPCPLGTSVIISANQRTLTRVPALLPFSDMGGVAAAAFDDDFGTSCMQTAANGSIGTTFSDLTRVTTVGILFSISGQFGIFYEYSLDGVTWTAIDATDITIDTATPQWFWMDIQGAPPAIAWRIRSVSTNILSVAELFFGNNPTEIPMGTWSLDDWNAMPVKNTPGAPWNWYQQRDIDASRLYVWPMPNEQAKYLQMVCWRRRFLNDLSDMNQELDVTRRWNEAITCSLARRLCLELPEADMQRFQTLNQAESSAMSLAIGEERDPAPMRYNPGLEVYKF